MTLKNIDILGWLFYLFFVFRLKANLLIFNSLVKLFCRIKGLHVGKKVKFNGFPIITRYPNSKISIGNNCIFNSSKRSVPMRLDKRCNFVTLRKGAEISIGNNAGVTGITIAAEYKVIIGDNVLIGALCTIIDTDFHNADPTKREVYEFSAKPVIIEDHVFMGANCLVLKGVTIGKNSVIGANSVVISNIPPNSFAMGNPCKLILKRNWEHNE